MHIGRSWLYSQSFKSIRNEDQWTSFLRWALPRVELPLGRGKLRALPISRVALAAAADLMGSTLPLGQGMCRHQELQSWSFWYGMEEFAHSGIASKFNLTCRCQMLCQTSRGRDLMWRI